MKNLDELFEERPQTETNILGASHNQLNAIFSRCIIDLKNVYPGAYVIVGGNHDGYGDCKEPVVYKGEYRLSRTLPEDQVTVMINDSLDREWAIEAIRNVLTDLEGVSDEFFESVKPTLPKVA